MNIAHLASFKGNIGDVINHEGLYSNLKRVFGNEITVQQIEIRDFYKNNLTKRFTEEFVEMLNDKDLFIIGGGNFFELCWDYSATGTTIDLSPELLKK